MTRIVIIYIVPLALLIAEVECIGEKNKTHQNITMTLKDDDLSDVHHYWDTSSSLEKGDSNEGSGAFLSLTGKLRRQFALSLFLESPMDSAVCSPVSALMPLGKLALGASGTTRKELLAAIGVNKLSMAKTHFQKMITELKEDTGVSISICSGIYLSKKDKLKRKFKKEAEEVFGVAVEKVDFSQPKDATDEINTWVSKHTNNKIKNLLKPSDVPPSTSVVLVNAVYFSGNWLYPFPKAKQGVFNGPNGMQNVHMLHLQELYKYYDSSSLNAEIVEIPYKKGSQASLIIVLPKYKSPASLTLLLKELKVAPDLLKVAMKKMKYRTISLTIPKFRIETKFDLGIQYRNIGLNSMFHKGFKKMVDGKELFVSKAVQAAMIEIDEHGTTAAAASATTYVKGIAPTEVILFTADHPFFFILKVRDQQLFSGVLNHFPDTPIFRGSPVENAY